VQSVLAARIDRLPEREKEVLQVSSVIGKEFSEPTLRRAVDLSDEDLPAALQALTSAEFIYLEALYPEAEWRGYGDGTVDGQASVAQSNPGTLILLLFLLFDGDLNLPLGEIRFV